MKCAAAAFSLLLVVLGARTPGALSSGTLDRSPHALKGFLRSGRVPAPLARADTQRLVISSLDGKFVRQIPLIGESNHVPMWSPDGKSIAFQVRDNGRNVIAVVQSDGSTPRVFRNVASATAQSARWSPDSRSIGFLDPGRHAFRLLNITTGNIRTVSTDSSAQVGVWIWRPDGRSIAAVMTTPGALPGLRWLQRRVDEITVEGNRRPLLDTAAMRGVPGVTFIDPYTIFFRTDSAAYRMPLSGGPPQRLVDLRGSMRPPTGVHTTAPTSDVWAGLIPGNNFEGGRIEFISAQSGERRVVAVPFRPMAGPSPEWTPSGRELIVAGRPPLDTTRLDTATIRLFRAGDTTTVRQLLARNATPVWLYRVPVNGGEPYRIATFGGTDGWTSVSPDETFVVYGLIDGR